MLGHIVGWGLMVPNLVQAAVAGKSFGEGLTAGDSMIGEACIVVEGDGEP